MIFKGWDNADIKMEESTIEDGETDSDYTQRFRLDILNPSHFMQEQYDYIFCNHMLSNFSYHELPTVLTNIKRLLAPGGVVHILVPDAIAAFEAYAYRDHEWFPQGEDMPLLDERLCTFLTWFGESKTAFSKEYLLELGRRAGFKEVYIVPWGKDPHDDRNGECIVAEFIR